MVDDTVHPYQVKTFLNAEEFTALKAIADSEGLTQSGYIRRLVKRSIASHCAEQVNNGEVPEWYTSGPYPFTFGNR